MRSVLRYEKYASFWKNCFELFVIRLSNDEWGKSFREFEAVKYYDVDLYSHFLLSVNIPDAHQNTTAFMISPNQQQSHRFVNPLFSHKSVFYYKNTGDNNKKNAFLKRLNLVDIYSHLSLSSSRNSIFAL